MHIPRQVVVAAMTVAAVTTISHSILPSSQDLTDPEKAQQRLHQQYSQNRKNELEALRQKADRDAKAIAADKLRPAEVRPADKAAAKAARALLRRP